MELHRDRAEGWKHAKNSGHENEARLEDLMKTDTTTINSFLERVGKANQTITHLDIGGLHETDVPCVFAGEKTKSKTDMHITLSDGSHYNVSIKKSLGGQVYLIGANRFINGYELQYAAKIPDNVKRAIHLFWGYADDTEAIINSIGVKKTYELHKHRLVADTLYLYDKSLYSALIDWFADNMYNIADFCFSKGLAKDPAEWATHVWYKNELGENQVDEIFSIAELCAVFQKHAKSLTTYGNKGGGTTIQLPFGFVQWHSPTKRIPGDMQFHHGYEKIKEIIG